MTTRSIFAYACILFGALSCLHSQAPKYQVLTHESEIVSGAVVTLLPNSVVHNQKPTKTVTVQTDAQGYFKLPEQFNTNDHGYLTIQAEGHAFAIYFWGPKTTTFKLHPSFEISGHVYLDEQVPVANAKVSIVASGLDTYMPIRLDTLNQCEQFTTLTDENGAFSIPGITHGEFFPSHLNRVRLLATKQINDKDWFGSATTVSALPRHLAKFKTENSAFWERHYANNVPSKIALYPSGTIAGRLIQAVTNTPISGAKISYPSIDGYGPSIQEVTDANGYFDFESVPARERYRLHIAHELFPYESLQIVNRNPFDLQTPRNDNLEIKARPSVFVLGKIVDAHSASAPLVPLDLSFEVNDSINEDWQQSLKLSYGNIGPDAKVSPEGTFKIKLPTGRNQLKISGPYNNRRYKPYNQIEEIMVKAAGPNELNIELYRSPGVLFHFNDSEFKELSDAGNLVVSCRQKNSRTSSYADDSYQWFWPTEKWGDEIQVNVEYRLKGTKVKLLEDALFKADPDSWPIHLDLSIALLHLHQNSSISGEVSQ